MAGRAVSDRQRRARLVARHHLGRTAADVDAAVRGVVALHSSDPLTPFLGVRARVPGATVTTLDETLYDARSLWRLHAVRRTLFVATLEDATILEAAAGRDVARKERRRLESWLAPEVGEARVDGWLADVRERTLGVLADGDPRSTAGLVADVPELATEVTLGSGRWTTRSPVSSRVMFLLAMDGEVVRARPVGTWRSSQYRWALATTWFGAAPARLDESVGRLRLAERYLGSHGPVTLADLRWWTGWIARHARAALAELGAVAVTLDDGEEGWVLPHDTEPVDVPVGIVALLPGLDPTPMGWKQRAWYLGPHTDQVFDRNGNAGPTVWVDGRVVGGWATDPGGHVRYRLLEEVAPDAEERIAAEADALTAWLDGVPVTPRFRTPLERDLTR